MKVACKTCSFFLEALLLSFLLPFQVALKANFNQMSPEYCWTPAPSSGLRSDLPVVTPNYSLWIRNGECHRPSQSDLGGLLSPRFPGPSPSLPASVNGLPIHLEVLLPLTCPPTPISKSYLLQSAYGTSPWFRPHHLSCLDFGPSSSIGVFCEIICSCQPLLKKLSRASLVAQWLRICLLMQGTRVRALVWEDPTCRGATRPGSHSY